jgi:hypothetical protein
MEALGTGLVLIANGALVIVRQLADFYTVVGVIAAISLWWLATMEIEELNRQGVKPDVARH